jgi:ubiquinone/menaquinone biosynthesis C-methylase UbiE
MTMAGVGRAIETRGHIVGFREEIRMAGERSPEEFFTWFDEARDPNDAFVRGAWDFSIHIAQPLAPFLSHPEDKTVLEIGHGAGRILASAARHFRYAVGVDVHEGNALVFAELARRGVTNVTLHQGDGKGLPLGDGEVDVVYTFIVMQHVERIAIFEGYLEQMHRVLKPGGLVMLYFGRLCRFSLAHRSPVLYLLDRLAERVVMARGYREIPAPVNHTNLLVTRPHAARLARRFGFSVLRREVSHKRVPDGTDRHGGQHGLVLRKQ